LILSRIRVPVLGIWGSNDRVSGRENMDAMRRGGFRVEIIDGAGHPAYLDRPDVFVRLVLVLFTFNWYYKLRYPSTYYMHNYLLL
jgi:hypothetical protein